jgi:hypothetical protein
VLWGVEASCQSQDLASREARRPDDSGSSSEGTKEMKRLKLHAVRAAVLAVGLGGLMASDAGAIDPTVSTNITFKGGVNIIFVLNPGTALVAYTVPADRRFMLTDLIIENSDNEEAAPVQFVTSGPDVCDTNRRTTDLSIQPADTLVIRFGTGIVFQSGHVLCGHNGSAILTNWQMRGYLF